MKEKIIIFIKGMILGIAMIIPGVSGGTLAISLGLYEKIIDCVSHFFKNFKKNILFIINLGLGILFAIGICALILNYTFEHAPVPTVLFFIGLLIGSIPVLLKRVNFKTTLRISNVFYLLLGAAIVFGVALLKGGSEITLLKGFDITQSIKLLVVGFIASATMVIPGISGSFVLMTLGYYYPILNTISDFVKLNNITENILILVPFGIGIIVGIFVIAKIIEYLLKKHEVPTYYSIIGFLFASIIQIVITLFSYKTNILQLIVAVFLFILGYLLTSKVFKNE